MSKFANVVTIEVAPGRRDQVVTLLLAHKARLKDEPGTLQFEVLLPKDDDTKVLSYEVYRDAAIRGASERAVPCTPVSREHNFNPENFSVD
jgi:quinol monooxygenase YgiN